MPTRRGIDKHPPGVDMCTAGPPGEGRGEAPSLPSRPLPAAGMPPCTLFRNPGPDRHGRRLRRPAGPRAPSPPGSGTLGACARPRRQGAARNRAQIRGWRGLVAVRAALRAAPLTPWPDSGAGQSTIATRAPQSDASGGCDGACGKEGNHG